MLDFSDSICYTENMENTVKSIVAQNLIELRKSSNMTQSDLAHKLNYSDKSISKWENGDSLPDIAVLVSLTEVYGITLDDLVHENAAAKIRSESGEKQPHFRNAHVILYLAVSVVLLIATLIFVYLKIKANVIFWQVFIWTIPVSCLAFLYAGRKGWGNPKGDKRYSAVVLSVFSWSLLAAIYLQFLQYQLWLIFILGLPLQAIFILATRLNR